jgi:hypothetical protein
LFGEITQAGIAQYDTSNSSGTKQAVLAQASKSTVSILLDRNMMYIVFSGTPSSKTPLHQRQEATKTNRKHKRKFRIVNPHHHTLAS